MAAKIKTGTGSEPMFDVNAIRERMKKAGFLGSAEGKKVSPLRYGADVALGPVLGGGGAIVDRARETYKGLTEPPAASQPLPRGPGLDVSAYYNPSQPAAAQPQGNGTGSGYRVVKDDKGRITLTNVAGDNAVNAEVQGMRDTREAARLGEGFVQPGQAPISVFSDRSGGANLSALPTFDLTKNKYTGQPNHGDVMGGSQGGNVDTIRHLRNVLMSDTQPIQTPGGHIKDTATETFPGTRSRFPGQTGGSRPAIDLTRNAAGTFEAPAGSPVDNGAGTPMERLRQKFAPAQGTAGEGYQPAVATGTDSQAFVPSGAGDTRSTDLTPQAPDFVSPQALNVLGASLAEGGNKNDALRGRSAVPGLERLGLADALGQVSGDRGPSTPEQALTQMMMAKGLMSRSDKAVKDTKDIYRTDAAAAPAIANAETAAAKLANTISSGNRAAEIEREQFDAGAAQRVADLSLTEQNISAIQQQQDLFKSAQAAGVPAVQLLGKGAKSAQPKAIDKLQLAKMVDEGYLMFQDDPRFEGMSEKAVKKIMTQDYMERINGQ